VTIPRQRIRVARDRIFGVHATCRRTANCVGAILVDSDNLSCSSPDGICFSRYGRADLRIPAQTTEKVLVGVTRKGLRYLRRHRRDRDVTATVYLYDVQDGTRYSGRLTLLAPR
jgi:hypothetical protein